DRGEHAVEQLARLADEGLAEPVFLRTGRFADEQPVGLLVAGAQDRLGAGLVQPARRAGWNDLLELDPAGFFSDFLCFFFLMPQAPDRREAHLLQYFVTPRHASGSVSTSASSRPACAG